MVIGYKNKNGQIESVQNVKAIQVDTLPTASASNVDFIYQYIGATDVNYTNGFFYKCVSDGAVDPTYSWVNIQIQPSSTTQVTLLPNASAEELNNIYQFIGTTAGSVINGYFYKCVSNGAIPPVYSWENISVQNNIQFVISGYYNISDGKFYKESAYTTEITGTANTEYIDIPNNVTYRWDGSEYVRLDEGSTIQYSVIPTANADNLGKIIQFIGTTGVYTNGYFYKCISDGENPPNYSWVAVKQPSDVETPREEKIITTASDFRISGQGSFTFKTSVAVTITLNDSNVITIPANTQGFLDIGEIDEALNDYIGVIQYTFNGYEKTIYFNSTIFYVPATSSVQIDDTNVSSATTYSSAKIETAIGGSKAAQMIGATAYQDGKEGLATKPVAGDNQKALFGDGKYHNIYAANTGSVVVAVTDDSDLYGQPVTLTAGSTTLSGTFSATGECTFNNLALYGTVQIASEDALGNPARGSTNITYFGTYVVGVGFNFATIKFTSTDISLVGSPVAVYLGNLLVAETSLSLINGHLEANCYVEQLGNYKAIAETPEGKARASVTVSALKQTYTAELIVADVYAFYIDKTDSNPGTCVHPYVSEYGCLNQNYTPAHMDFTNNHFEYGSWGALQTCDRSTLFFAPKPCMLAYDGTVDYYLDPDDFSKKADGTASDVSDMNYNGNVMVEFPTVWFKRWEENNCDYVIIANKQLDADFHAWAHHDKNGNVLPYIYIAAYDGSFDGTRMRSISGCTYSSSITSGKIISNVTRSQEINYAIANNDVSEQGEGWYIYHKAEWDMISDLLLLIGMNTNSQSTFGSGNSNGSQNSELPTGSMDNKGCFWGSNSGYTGVKVFFIENPWASLWKSCSGWININMTPKIKMTYGQEDGSLVDGFNLDGNGYVTMDPSSLVGSNHAFCSSWTKTEYGLIPTIANGSASTYLCDVIWYNSSINSFVRFGGCAGESFNCGIYNTTLQGTLNETYWGSGAAITYKGISS